MFDAFWSCTTFLCGSICLPIAILNQACHKAMKSFLLHFQGCVQTAYCTLTAVMSQQEWTSIPLSSCLNDHQPALHQLLYGDENRKERIFQSYICLLFPCSLRRILQEGIKWMLESIDNLSGEMVVLIFQKWLSNFFLLLRFSTSHILPPQHLLHRIWDLQTW